MEFFKSLFAGNCCTVDGVVAPVGCDGNALGNRLRDFMVVSGNKQMVACHKLPAKYKVIDHIPDRAEGVVMSVYGPHQGTSPTSISTEINGGTEVDGVSLNIGDYLVCGVKGEQYVIKAADFPAKYELSKDGSHYSTITDTRYGLIVGKDVLQAFGATEQALQPTISDASCRIPVKFGEDVSYQSLVPGAALIHAADQPWGFYVVNPDALGTYSKITRARMHK
jgi:hypothetical protein